MNTIQYTPIGIIHTPFKSAEGTPIQPKASNNAKATIEIFPPYVEGLKDLEGFSHLILLFHLHKIKHSNLTPTPYMDTVPRGVFATRAPARPNPIGFSIVELEKVDGNRLYIQQADMLDETPLLDIKIFVPGFEPSGNVRIGWLEDKIEQLNQVRDDGRFTK